MCLWQVGRGWKVHDEGMGGGEEEGELGEWRGVGGGRGNEVREGEMECLGALLHLRHEASREDRNDVK